MKSANTQCAKCTVQTLANKVLSWLKCKVPSLLYLPSYCAKEHNYPHVQNVQVTKYASLQPVYHLVFYGMITLPARGERHASAQPTVLSCRHSREVTRRDSLWLTGIKSLSVTLLTCPKYLIHKNRPCGNSGQLFFSFFLHGPLTPSRYRCSYTGSTADTYATASKKKNSL